MSEPRSPRDRLRAIRAGRVSQLVNSSPDDGLPPTEPPRLTLNGKPVTTGAAFDAAVTHVHGQKIQQALDVRAAVAGARSAIRRSAPTIPNTGAPLSYSTNQRAIRAVSNPSLATTEPASIGSMVPTKALRPQPLSSVSTQQFLTAKRKDHQSAAATPRLDETSAQHRASRILTIDGFAKAVKDGSTQIPPESGELIDLTPLHQGTAQPAPNFATDPSQHQTTLKRIQASNIDDMLQWSVDDRLEALKALASTEKLPDSLVEIGKRLVLSLPDDQAYVDLTATWLDEFSAILQGPQRGFLKRMHSWATLTTEQRKDIVRELVLLHAAFFRYTPATIEFVPTDRHEALASYNSKNHSIRIDVTKANFINNGAMAATATPHEAMHAFQFELINALAGGSLPETDPRYEQATLLALNMRFQTILEKAQANKSAYETQPLERGAAIWNGFVRKQFEKLVHQQ